MIRPTNDRARPRFRAVRSPLLALVLAAGVSGCGLPSGDQVEDTTGPLFDGPVCVDPALKPAEIKARKLADEVLLAAVRSGRADPVAEARRAIAAGDWRLAGAAVEAPGSSEPYGAECRVPGGLDSRSLRALAFAGDGGAGGDVAAFGRRYNEAIMSAPGYPYGDVCRATTGAADDISGPEQLFGFGGLRFNTRPMTLAHAARSGSAAAIVRLSRRAPGGIDTPDLFGMTALSWAVAYRRSEAVELLLARRASAAGPGCQSVLDARSPVQIARAMEWGAMVRRLLPLVPEAERDMLEQKTAALPDSLTAFNQALLDLNGRYREELASEEPGADQHKLMLEVDKTGETTSCRLDPPTTSPRFDAELCADAKLLLKWRPARNIYGKPVKGETSINLVGVGR